MAKTLSLIREVDEKFIVAVFRGDIVRTYKVSPGTPSERRLNRLLIRHSDDIMVYLIDGVLGVHIRWGLTDSIRNESVSPPWAPSRSGPATYSADVRGGVREVQNVR